MYTSKERGCYDGTDCLTKWESISENAKIESIHLFHLSTSIALALGDSNVFSFRNCLSFSSSQLSTAMVNRLSKNQAEIHDILGPDS